MSVISDDALIARLRRTYTAVAEATPVSTPPYDVTAFADEQMQLRAGAHIGSGRSGRSGMLLVAASLVLVLGGLAALVVLPGRDGATSTSLDELAARVRHATLSVRPDGFGLLSITTDDVTDRLVFGDGTREIHVITRRDRAGATSVATFDPTTDVRDRPAEVTGTADSGFTVRWTERPGVVVEIDTTGTWALGDVLSIAEQVVMVTDSTWAEMTRYDGFAAVAGADRAVIDGDSPRLPQGGRLDRSVTGSLQSGVNVLLGNSIGITTAPTLLDMRIADSTHLVLATGDVATIRIVGSGDALEITPRADPGAPQVFVASYSTDAFPPDDALAIEFVDASGTVIDAQQVER